MEKKNKLLKNKLLKDEKVRIGKLANFAYQNDPRIIKYQNDIEGAKKRRREE